MAKVVLKNINKTYSNGVVAVDNFNLEIKDKEFVTFVGPSGCGKSTTLRMIAGLEDISQGDLYIDNILSNDVPPKDRDIAMVFQNYALYPHMTVYQNMAFGLQLRKFPKSEIKRRVEETAKVLDIAHLLDRRPQALSGGQRQRVSLGRAIVRDPKVFLLDEPLSNLDAKLRTQMRAEISKLHSRLGTTFIYVTHDQTEAMTMADRIVVMKDGLIQQVDTPQDIYEKPVNQFVAGFVGSPQMNFADVKLQKESDQYAVELNKTIINLSKSASKSKSLSEYENKEVVLGIRPEHLYECSSETCSDQGIVEAGVEVTELMGAEKYLHILIGTQVFVTRVESHNSAKVGDRIKVRFNADKIYLFDKKTGQTIL